ncbi:hypothetical protein IFM89_017208 [Coptis chinensis]|uniref:Enoyl reductase (ER) domain-containing protein n=1 Tax=Coptis chinensis TaxID=261450 RepID=A0A835I2V2_9MAGN|nr:hypothetical protein IFM89_017208 [Coptis chinensis]
MKAVVITTPGGPEVLKLEEVETPGIGNNQVLIKVEATAISRADTYQRQGNHPPPPGASPYPGLECSGTIEAVGNDVTRWKVGDQVCALLSGGGYAEKVAVSANQVLPVPPGVSLKDAASFPEVACTVWSTVFMTSRLSVGEIFLVHGGSSGIGTFAIQMAKYIGARVFVTAGSEEKLAFCKDLGADVCINYKTEDFAARVTEETGGRGVDVILDNIGGPYFQKNLNSLSIDGRLFLLGFQGGPVASDINLAFILARRLTVQGGGRLLGNLFCQCSLGLLEVGLLSTMQSHPGERSTDFTKMPSLQFEEGKILFKWWNPELGGLEKEFYCMVEIDDNSLDCYGNRKNMWVETKIEELVSVPRIINVEERLGFPHICRA